MTTLGWGSDFDLIMIATGSFQDIDGKFVLDWNA